MSDLVSQNLNMIFKTPKGETVHALKDVNFTLKKGELLTVLGPSGCGKTTLLNITAGFIRPSSGSITLNNNLWLSICNKYFKLPGNYFQFRSIFNSTIYLQCITTATKYKEYYKSTYIIEKNKKIHARMVAGTKIAL